MSSKRSFQESLSSERLEGRKKLDAQLTDVANPQLMENPAEKSKSPCNLRMSLAWDNAFFTSPGVLDPEELYETLNLGVKDGGVDVTGNLEPKSFCSRSAEIERASGRRECSVRKSLAWDSAFFTSAGVLDPEELSIVNRGFQEEMLKSAEPISTVSSDSFSLASLEIELFDNIRTSMPKSCEASSNEASSICRVKEEGKVCRVKEEGKVHSPQISVAPSRLRHGPSRDSNLSLSQKLPKSSSSFSPLPPLPKKRVALGVNNVKMNRKPSASETMKKTCLTCLRESCPTFPGSKPSERSPSSVLPAASDGSLGNSCARVQFKGKSGPNLVRRTTDSGLPLCVSPQTPSKYLSKKSKLVTPSSKSFDSPAGSTGGSSTVSLTTSLLGSNDCAGSLIQSPGRGILFSSDASPSLKLGRNHHDQVCLGRRTPETKSASAKIGKRTAATSPATAGAFRSSTVSGLRKPSPKIGFFDLENITRSAPGVQSICSKSGSGIRSVNGSAKRARCGNGPLVGISTGISDKTVTKDNSKVCIVAKEQFLKEHEDIIEDIPRSNIKGLDEDNKENICCWRNQLDDLSRHIEAIVIGKN